MSNLEPLVKIGNWYYQAVYGQLWPVDQAMPATDIIRLEPRLHALLNYLLLHPGQLLAKDTLIEKVWPANEGTDAAVMRAIGALRRILEDDVRAPRYIATVSKKGYCWLAEIEPLTSGQPELHPAVTAEISENTCSGFSWRFVAAVIFCLLTGGASLAYVLASVTTVPLTRLPDLLKPVSALSGMEYWPLFDVQSDRVIYQHQPPGAVVLNWARQDLQSLKVSHDTEYYQRLSEAVWHDEQHIRFRAVNADGQCYIYHKQVLPVFAAARPLFSCQQFFTQGIQYWHDRLVWLDADDTGQHPALWQLSDNDYKQPLYTLHADWLSVDHLQLHQEYAYLLARTTFAGSALVRVSLQDGTVSILKKFPFLVTQISKWDEQHLLLSDQHQELQLFNLRSSEFLGLGLLTHQLTQARRYQHRVLATQTIDYKTDILQVQLTPENSRVVRLAPWQISNRSESMVAIAEDRTAFVTERSGYNQIWLMDSSGGRQITHLKSGEQLQQLLWYQQLLLAVINNRLFIIDQASGSMKTFHNADSDTAVGRYQSCGQELYWTEYTTGSGWQLMQQAADGIVSKLYDDVADVRCAPDGLVLQLWRQQKLVWWRNHQLTELAVNINWREYEPQWWQTNSSGIYWLDKAEHGIRFVNWRLTEPTLIKWPAMQLPVALISDEQTLRYVVRPRAYDTDIVWLQNR
ncbi:winged helix-turn-helix domain-containing protein [Chromatiaceae bacterium AAb-1]|nr:winged helix-turn-helix domain-containing protein [Chromatiaceae bacterium AAb-1]